MKYIISIKRLHDGEEVGKVVDDFEVAESNLDLIGYVANDLWKHINQMPEKHQYFQQQTMNTFHTSNPDKPVITNMVRDLYEKKMCELWEQDTSAKFPWGIGTWEMKPPETTEDGTIHRAVLELSREKKEQHERDAELYVKGVFENGNDTQTD